MEEVNLAAGWVGILLGVIAGAIIGLFFHKEDWLGGYGSHPRRLIRLGHISFFGLGFLNILYALTARQIQVAEAPGAVGSIALLVALATMPLCCFLTAWKPPFRQLFPIPVIATVAAVVSLLIGWRAQ